MSHGTTQRLGMDFVVLRHKIAVIKSLTVAVKIPRRQIASIYVCGVAVKNRSENPGVIRLLREARIWRLGGETQADSCFEGCKMFHVQRGDPGFLYPHIFLTRLLTV